MLTTTQIKNIKTGILSDVGPHRGLRLNATSAGKSWIFRYKNFEGKIKQLKLGMYPTMPLAEAREKVADYKQMRRDGIDPKQDRQKKIEEAIEAANQAKWEEHKQAYLVRDMVEHYLDEHIEKNRNYKGGKEVRRVFERDALSTLGQIPAAELRRSHIHNLVVMLPASIGRDVKRE